MFNEMMVLGSGGGGTALNPQTVTIGVISGASSASYTIDTSKSYIVTCMMTYNNAANNASLVDYIDKGTLTNLTASVRETSALNGTTYTITGSSSYYHIYTIVQLD